MLKELPILTISLQAALGVLLAAGLLFYARRLNKKAQLSVMAVALFVASLIYVLFALITFNKLFIIIEVVGLLFFLMFIWLAYHHSFWFVALGWLLHIVWDIGVHPHETAPYVPQWYAWVCVGFDAVIAFYLMILLARHSENS